MTGISVLRAFVGITHRAFLGPSFIFAVLSVGCSGDSVSPVGAGGSGAGGGGAGGTFAAGSGGVPSVGPFDPAVCASDADCVVGQDRCFSPIHFDQGGAQYQCINQGCVSLASVGACDYYTQVCENATCATSTSCGEWTCPGGVSCPDVAACKVSEVSVCYRPTQPMTAKVLLCPLPNGESLVCHAALSVGQCGKDDGELCVAGLCKSPFKPGDISCKSPADCDLGTQICQGGALKDLGPATCTAGTCTWPSPIVKTSCKNKVCTSAFQCNDFGG